MIVNLPSEFTKNTMGYLLNQVIDHEIEPKDKEIEFDFNYLNVFIEPSGVTILSNLFEWLKKKGVDTYILHPDGFILKGPLKYLDDSRFFEKYVGEKLNESSRPRTTTFPLESVQYNHSPALLELRFIPWLSRRLNVNAKSLIDIKICLEEIFNNINDHAHENTGCIYAQHYPNKDNENKVVIAISDFGVGIPYNIRKVKECGDDGETLKEAIKEGVSSRSTPRNRGAGLHTLVKNVVENNGGRVHIHSNNGILSCYKVNNAMEVHDSNSDSFYPGTFIEIQLMVNNIEFIEDDEEEFEW